MMLTLLPLGGQGDIVYRQVNLPIYGEPQNQQIDLNSDGIDDFEFTSIWMDIGVDVTVSPLGDNRLIAAGNGYDALAINGGGMISESAPSDGQWIELPAYFNGHYLDQTYGQFYNINAFVGVELQIDGNTHYGWIQFDNPEPIYGGYVTGFAYETEASSAIEAGAVPEPGTIILFLIGTIGVFFFRKNLFSRDFD